MFNRYIEQAQKLINQGQSFVVVLVVNYQAPISGKSGDRALVTADGELWGWVAGGCSRSIVVEEALEVLKTGIPKMIQITPDPENSKDNMMKHKMTCHSGGTLDVYLEPVIARPQVIVLGRSMVAEKVAELSKAMDYEVHTELAGEEIKPSDQHYVVVATQGEGDEEALQAALALNPSYLGFVSSKKKWEAVKKILSEIGVSNQQLSTIKAPAGLDIKARRPEEIALSILAEIVMSIRQGRTTLPVQKKSEKAIDPICGMSVDKETAKYVYNHAKTPYYFCCEGCRVTFAKEPEKYLT